MADAELSNPSLDGGTVASTDVPAQSGNDTASGNIVEQVNAAGTQDSAAPSESTDGTRGTNDAGADDKPDRGFDLLTSDLPENETFSLDGFYKGIKPEHLEKLDPLSKQVIHNLRRDYHNKRQRDSAKARDLESSFNDKVTALKDQERSLLTRQKAFANLIDDPKLKEILSRPEGELPDLLSPEGIQARIERATAEQLQKLVKPIAEHSERETRRHALGDFMETHPEMTDASFRGDVAEIIRQRRSAGFALSTPDAYELVKAKRGAAERQRLEVRQRQVRAASARQIGKSKANAARSSGPPKGAKAQEVYAWVKANQEEAKRLAGLK